MAFVSVRSLANEGDGRFATNPSPALGEITTLPPVFVTAQKEITDAQNTPLSVSAVTAQTIEDAKINSVRDASIYAPNVVMTDFSARKLSNPRFRGLGASPNNPAVTTYYDGVPQFSATSSSIELLDVEQIEFVRGPQGALFGRNTVGGLININSTRPSLKDWVASATGTYGNYDLWDGRASVSAPMVEDKLGFGVGFGWSSREGYTKNDVTGHDLDSREAFFGKGQLLWLPTERWEVRLLLTGEQARDGDYALGDLTAIRARPHHVARNFEGFTRRDLIAPTLLANYFGERVDFSLITGGVWWKTADETDLDYTPAPLGTRHNEEQDVQFTQEIRLASAKDAPWRLCDNASLKWQGGVFFFIQNYEQEAFNDLNPPLSPVSLRSASQARLDDIGLGIYGQATLMLWEKLDLTVGARGDVESKEATLRSFTTPALSPPGRQNLSDDFSECTPQFSAMYHITPDCAAYATAARGFKAGGFNSSSPPGTERYGQEDTWNYEAGFKTEWCNHRLTANFAAFYTCWDNLQLNVRNPFVPGQFYIANVGSADSKGVEFELNARPVEGWDVFASVGYDEARFLSGSESSGASVAGNRVPFTPDYTANAGMQYAFACCKEATLYARAEVIVHGRFFYDDQNSASQAAYTLANFRAGMRGKHWFAEGWVKNAFDANYVPVALAYPGLAPSGLIGESGAPVTFGLTAGVRF
ncbi:MAG: TonB-dependent receptor [Verrucomicrobia bacterium]|nr:TonB-dependent receptor [Verrucomicrobiota bacterium]